MDEKGRKESGASEVIGAVLLVALVVIGGAVVAAMVFGQPTPKEVPHVSFGVTKDNSINQLTLHHTGGDSLVWDEYNVYVDGEPMTGNIPFEDRKPWSSDGKLRINGVTQMNGTVVLAYRGNGVGETSLRIVDFEDDEPPGLFPYINGTKWDVTDGEGNWVPVPGVTINISRKVGSDRILVYSGATNSSGQYLWPLPPDESGNYAWGLYVVEEVCPTGMRVVSPPHGVRQVNVNEDHPVQQQDFENEIVPPVPAPSIAIDKVTRNGTSEGDELTITEGTPITWKYTVTNPGNVPLSNIQVTDNRGVTPVYVSGDTNGDNILDLTETWIYQATGTAIEGDYCNTGTARGRPPTGSAVEASDGSCYTGTQLTSTVTISGRKSRVNELGGVIGPQGCVTIKLILVDPLSLAGLLKQDFGFSTQNQQTFDTTQTLADGSYTFVVPDVPAKYCLTETGLDPKSWFVQYPTNGSYSNVAPGATGMDFGNYQVPGDGIVMYLEKAVGTGCLGGRVVNNTTIEGEARGGNHVSFKLGNQEQDYVFSNGEQFRFTIVNNQTAGEFKIERFAMTALTFNVRFEVRPNRNSPWVNATQDLGKGKPFNPSGGFVIGSPTEVFIDAVNKNLLNEDSTLTYAFPPISACAPSDTLLRLNGQVAIDDPADDPELLFTDLHEVHDNRYGEGLNTLWIYLMPGYDNILAQGVCVYP